MAAQPGHIRCRGRAHTKELAAATTCCEERRRRHVTVMCKRHMFIRFRINKGVRSSNNTASTAHAIVLRRQHRREDRPPRARCGQWPCPLGLAAFLGLLHRKFIAADLRRARAGLFQARKAGNGRAVSAPLAALTHQTPAIARLLLLQCKGPAPNNQPNAYPPAAHAGTPTGHVGLHASSHGLTHARQNLCPHGNSTMRVPGAYSPRQRGHTESAEPVAASCSAPARAPPAQRPLARTCQRGGVRARKLQSAWFGACVPMPSQPYHQPHVCLCRV